MHAVILNHGTPDLTIAAVRSLEASTAPPARVIVVDNGSTDDSVNRIRAIDVHVIASPVNLGFAAGSNLGIRAALAAGADRVFLLNSDATVAPDCLAVLEAALDNDPTLGIVGPVVVTAVDPGVVETTGIRYVRATGRMRHDNFGRRVADLPPFTTRPVDGVSGCAMLVTRSAFEKVGLFDEAFFFGFEDLDFCLRAADAGLAVACVGGAVAVHVGSATAGRRSPRRLWHALVGHLRVARQHPGPGGAAGRAARAAAIVGMSMGGGFRVQGSRFRVQQGSGFKVQGSAGFRGSQARGAGPLDPEP